MEICPPPPSPTDHPQSIITIKNTICLDHDVSCNCCCCCNPQPGYLRYIQPEVPKSFKPTINKLLGKKHVVPTEKNTTYKLSYWGGSTSNASVLKPVLPQDSLMTGDGTMTDETIHKLSYLGNWSVKRDDNFSKNPSWRTTKQWLGRGPMQNDTTHKNDFTWKYTKPLKKIRKKPNNLYCPCAAMSDNTTYKMSYYESNCGIPVKSFKPKVSKHVYPKSNVPIEGCTIYNLSYWQNEIPLKEKYSWKPKINYKKSLIPLDDYTTYRLSYWPNNNPHVRKPFTAYKVSENILNAERYFNDTTIYNLSYYNNSSDDSHKRKAIKPIVRPAEFSSCPMSHDTINRLSYLGNWRVPRESSKKNVPSKTMNQWFGRGPIQNETTHKQDYNWKCTTRDRIYTRPDDNLEFSNLPLECCTTHKMSYWPNDIKNLIKDKSFKPKFDRVEYPPDVPMENETTMRLSYQPVETAVPQSKSWKKGLEYHPSFIPIDDNTTYNLSYIPPGTLEPFCSDESCPPMPNDVCQGSCNVPSSQSSSPMYTPCCIAQSGAK